MIFKQLDLVLDGQKTQTRRLLPLDRGQWYITDDGSALYKMDKQGRFRCAYAVGGLVAIQPKRGAKAVEGKRAKIARIRVQHLQDIDEEDAIAEGCKGHVEGVSYVSMGRADPVYTSITTPIGAYMALWNSLHDKAGERWDDNRLIAALTFGVVTI